MQKWFQHLIKQYCCALYPHGWWPGIRGLQYGGDGRQYAAGGLPGGGAGAGWGYDDEGGYGYGEEDGVEELGARMAAMTADQRKAALEAAARSQSSKRYQEMERERKRRQLKTQGGQEKTTFFQSTKLALMNSGLIPLKKGESSPVFDSNSRHYLLVPVQYGIYLYFDISIVSNYNKKYIIFLPH